MYVNSKMYMNYTEFKKKYPFATKEYPDTMSLPFNSDKFIGSMTKTKQVKKGSRWINTEECITINIADMDNEEYEEIMEATFESWDIDGRFCINYSTEY